MKKKKRIGEMLIEEGLISEEQLSRALVANRQTNMKLGQFLMRQGIVSETDMLAMLSRQLKVSRFRAEDYPVNVELAKIIPPEVAQKYQVAPLVKKGSLLKVAMSDPMDITTMDAVEVLANAEVEPVICSEQELNQLHTSIYGTYSDLDGVLESIEQVKFETESEQEAAIGELEVSSLQGMAEEAPVVRLVNSILSQAIAEKASDVHISPEKDYVQVRFRVDGKLHHVPAPPKSMFLPVVSRLKILSEMDIAMSRIPQDGRFTVKMQNREINVRSSTIPTIYGENVVLRLLDTSGGVLSLTDLGISEGDREKLVSAVTKPYGMILSTGPTGSGKSTSLYSILKRINHPDTNIITLEDPVEFRVENIRQVQLNKKAGMSFASGLRSILRQDPDVIMLGEIRDAETASIAVQAAMTGHRVLSTVHTNDAAGAITRFIDMGIEPFLVSSVLLVSFAQRLVRKVCPNCREPYQPDACALRPWGNLLDGVDFQKGRGCLQCMDSGYKGRTGIFEVLIHDEVVGDMVLQRKSAQEITREVQKSGKLRSLMEDAADKIRSGITTLEEAASAVMS